MHWFWRTTIAAVVGLTYAWISVVFERTVFWPLASRITKMLFGISTVVPGEWRTAFVITMVYFLPPVLLTLATYAALTKWLAPSIADRSETRCRKCGYILRGISQPRCPECGEQI